MNEEELYKLALSDVVKYPLLNEIFAIRDTRIETVDYTIGVNGFISLDVLNGYVDLQQERDKYKSIVEELKEIYSNTIKHLRKIGNDELAEYMEAQINNNNVFVVNDM